MKYAIVGVFLCVFLSILAKADTPVQLRRICKTGKSNTLYFTPSSDTCSAYFQYKIWGRNGPFGSFILIDSIAVKSQDEYVHVGANPIGSPTKWSYYIEITDSCGPDYSTSSTIVAVDETPPNTTFIDFVTVDPNTNTVQVGWHLNTSPDFSYSILYKDSSGVYVPVYSGKDTFVADNNPFSDPGQKAITYDISPVDSCGNAKVFGVNPHTTIYLQHQTDTCKRSVNLSWSPYIGWSAVSSYYIYKKTGSGSYILIDSIFPPQLNYTDTITLGLSYSYYVVANQSGNTGIKSSSNSILFTTRFRIEPMSSYLALVSVEKPGDETVIIRLYNPNEECAKYDVFSGSSISTTGTGVGSIPNPSRQNGLLDLQLPFIVAQKYFSATAYNACSESYPVQNKSRYIGLSIQSGNAENRLSWDPYFTWNVGIDHYNIYRGTSDEMGVTTFQNINRAPGTDSTYIDNNLPSRVGDIGLCYYVEAVQNAGDINGVPLSSFSTTACATGDFTVFIPNAFRPEGTNKTFRPEGSYIDYELSRMEIFDRWGARLIEIQGIRKGWDGKDSNGVYCMQGVYYFKAYITSTNGIEKVFTGFVTLLN